MRQFACLALFAIGLMAMMNAVEGVKSDTKNQKMQTIVIVTGNVIEN